MKRIFLAVLLLVFCITDVNAKSYYTTFPLTENPISEGGKWTHGTHTLGGQNIKTVGGNAVGTGDSGYNDAVAYLTGDGTWGADQSVQVTIYNPTPSTFNCAYEEVELHLRGSVVAGTPSYNKSYEVTWNVAHDTNCGGSPNYYLLIVRWNGGLDGEAGPVEGTYGDHGDDGFTLFVVDYNAIHKVYPGDVLKATIVGQTINAYKNGVLVGTYTDNHANKITSGVPGIGHDGPEEGGQDQYGVSDFLAWDSNATADLLATAKTQALLTYLRGLTNLPIGSANKILSGQYNSADGLPESTGAYTYGGKWPAVLGRDYHQRKWGDIAQNAEAIAWDANKGIVTMTMWFDNPDGTDLWSGAQSVNLTAMTTPDGTYNSWLNTKLDAEAVLLRELATANVPVILRMFPEMEGTWNWWGNKGGTEFTKLWIYAYNRLVVTNGLHNLLFFWCPDRYSVPDTVYYPGSAYVDIVGFDIYGLGANMSTLASRYNSFVALGKPFAIGEYGYQTPDAGSFALDIPTGTNPSNPRRDLNPLITSIQTYMPKTVFWMNWDGSPNAVFSLKYNNINLDDLFNNTVVATRDDSNNYGEAWHSLSVSKAGTGTGTVTSGEVTPTINCGSTCSYSYASGTSVALTATTTDTFTGWSGAGCSGTGTCTVVMNAATSVTATFTPAATTIYADNSLAANCSGNYSITNRTCTGTDGYAYKLLQSALTAATSNSIIYVRTGDYRDEGKLLTPTTITNVTISGYSTETASINRIFIRSGSNNYTVTKLHIRGAGAPNAGNDNAGTQIRANYATVSYNKFYGVPIVSNGGGVAVAVGTGTTGSHIHHNTIEGPCYITGTHTGADSYVLNIDPATLSFYDFTSDYGTKMTTITTNSLVGLPLALAYEGVSSLCGTRKSATCTIASNTATTVTCGADSIFAARSEIWKSGDPFLIGYGFGSQGYSIIYAENGSSQALIENNTIRNQCAAERIFEITGIDHIVRSNEIANIKNPTNCWVHPDLFQMVGAGTLNNLLVEKNYFHDLDAALSQGPTGSTSMDVNNLTLRNNIFANIKGNPDWDIARTGVNWFNNTFYNVGNTGAYSGLAIDNKYLNGTTRLQNNIFIGMNTTATLEIPVCTGGGTCISTNNYFGTVAGVARSSTGCSDGTCVNGGDPGFVAPFDDCMANVCDFSIAAGSILNDKGVNLASLGGFTTDYEGRERGTLWSIGAYEYVTTSDVNIALGKTITASSEYPGGGREAVLANDGLLNTRWSSVYTDPQWIKIDLAAIYDVTRVILRWEVAYGASYTIQVSTDDLTYTTVYTRVGGDGGDETIDITSVPARYIKVNGTVRGTVWGYSLWEFEVYGTFSVFVGSTSWGHSVSATEPTKLAFSDTWTCYPASPSCISGSGDAERITLVNVGDYAYTTNCSYVGANKKITLKQSYYRAGDNVTLKYRTGISNANCIATPWSTYSTPFWMPTGATYIGVRVEK